MGFENRRRGCWLEDEQDHFEESRSIKHARRQLFGVEASRKPLRTYGSLDSRALTGLQGLEQLAAAVTEGYATSAQVRRLLWNYDIPYSPVMVV